MFYCIWDAVLYFIFLNYFFSWRSLTCITLLFRDDYVKWMREWGRWWKMTYQLVWQTLVLAHRSAWQTQPSARQRMSASLCGPIVWTRRVKTKTTPLKYTNPHFCRQSSNLYLVCVNFLYIGLGFVCFLFISWKINSTVIFKIWATHI